jgi:acetolactate synthase small subunit
MIVRCYSLETTDRPDVLARVVTLCQQRRCAVTSLHYTAGDRHRHAQLVLSVCGSGWHADRLATWLGGLVDVIAVRERR